MRALYTAAEVAAYFGAAVVAGAATFAMLTTHPEPKASGVWYVVNDLECSDVVGVEYTTYGKLLHCRKR